MNITIWITFLFSWEKSWLNVVIRIAWIDNALEWLTILWKATNEYNYMNNLSFSRERSWLNVVLNAYGMWKIGTSRFQFHTMMVIKVATLYSNHNRSSLISYQTINRNRTCLCGGYLINLLEQGKLCLWWYL